MDNTETKLCIVCHQILKPEYYFCPNCGTKVQDSPLSTNPAEQTKLYIYSIVLPWIGFFTIGKWDGIKYVKSRDEKTKQIGIIACVLMGVSFVILCYIGYIQYQSAVKSINDSITADFGI